MNLRLRNISDDGDEDEAKVLRQEQLDDRFTELLKEKQALEKVCKCYICYT